MAKNEVKVHYDEDSDILYFAVRSGHSHEVVEAGPGLVLEMDEKGKIMGIEIWDARKKKILQQVVKAVQTSD